MRKKLTFSIILMASSAMLIALCVVLLNVNSLVANQDNQASTAILSWAFLGVAHFIWPILALLYLVLAIIALKAKSVITTKWESLLLTVVSLAALPLCVISSALTFKLASYSVVMGVFQALGIVAHLAATVTSIVVLAKTKGKRASKQDEAE